MARGTLARLAEELRPAPSAAEGEAAIARLRAARSEDDNGKSVLEISGSGERPLAELGESEADIVRIARDVYASVPTLDARVRLLTMARRAARETVVVHVVLNDEATHLGRALIDAPRRLLRSVGVDVPEPGDRFGPDRYAHCFFDEEALLEELARAALTVTERRGFAFLLRPLDAAAARRHAPGAEIAAPFIREVARVARLVRAVDDRRRTDTPQNAVKAMRTIGRNARVRGPIGRARLRRAIGWVDAILPGGASCYRRILLELALDAGAASETVVFGLDVGRTGHVAFENREERTFDVSFAIPPE